MRILIAVLLLALASRAGAQLEMLAETTPARRAAAQTAYMTKAEAIRALPDAKDGDLQPILTADQLATHRSGKDTMTTAGEAELAKAVGGP